MALSLTKYSGNLAAQLVILRRSVPRPAGGGGGGVTNNEDTGVQRIGPLTSNAGNTHLCYYDPVSDVIFYDDGYPRVSPEEGTGE